MTADPCAGVVSYLIVRNNVPPGELAFTIAASEEVLISMRIHVLFLICYLVEASPTVLDWAHEGLLARVDSEVIK